MAIIDPNWVEIQTGLYLEPHSFTVGGTTYYNSRLHSADGYCFYDVTEQIYDEDGNLVPPENVQPSQRTYAQYCVTPITDIDELNATYISVPVDPSYEIVSVPNNNETI